MTNIELSLQDLIELRDGIARLRADCLEDIKNAPYGYESRDAVNERFDGLLDRLCAAIAKELEIFR